MSQQPPESPLKSLLWLWKKRLGQHNQEAGNTLIIAISLGVLLIGATSTMIFTSSRNRTNVTSDEYAQQTVSIGEAGIAQIIAELNSSNKKGLLLKTFDPEGYLGSPLNQWEKTTTLQYIVNACGATTTQDVADELMTVTLDADGKLNSDSITFAKGEYKLLAYRYTQDPSGSLSGKGQLLVQSNIDGNSQSRLLIEAPITVEPSWDVSGTTALMATEFNMQQSDAIASNIICTDPALCPLSCNPGQDEPTTDDLRESIKATSNSEITDVYSDGTTNITIASATIPPIPPPPTGIINYGPISGNKTFPESGDVPISMENPDGTFRDVYVYQISSWNSSEILIESNAEVHLYISGGVIQGGNDDLRLVDPNATPRPGQIRVYGNPPANGTQDWLLSGNACTMAFIHAPYANIGIDGGGNGCSGIDTNDAVTDANLLAESGTTYTTSDFTNPTGTNIYGAVWSKTYNVIGNPSNSSVFYEQPGLMEVISSEIPGIPGLEKILTGSFSQWERREVGN
ncbi:hypothetical protein IQ215_01770 [Cyanobacterium stanieri LEGE 03274]|uniref:Uncharacterized protein n=1 Tax=Cyanobacterium stanieri LEGE 03274 TaxID=1828756 RepID=A0ABR9V0K3_9CHRO|nr:hypothetical protein [Cyanobacterium stanieri]MBE9221414.1 hypothetical protein [Cyanobacterium stanieri LEGE 03274]